MLNKSKSLLVYILFVSLFLLILAIFPKRLQSQGIESLVTVDQLSENDVVISDNFLFTWRVNTEDNPDYLVQLFQGSCSDEKRFIKTLTEAEVESSLIGFEFDSNTIDNDLKTGRYCISLLLDYESRVDVRSNYDFRISDQSLNSIYLDLEQRNFRYLESDNIELDFESNLNQTDINYELVDAPNFLSINNDGILRNNDNLRAGSYQFEIKANNNQYSKNEIISIDIYRDSIPDDPIFFSNLSDKSIITGDNFILNWESSLDDVRNVILSYSEGNDLNWQNIINIPSSSFTKYNWDISQLDNDKFYLRITSRTDTSVYSWVIEVYKREILRESSTEVISFGDLEVIGNERLSIDIKIPDSWNNTDFDLLVNDQSIKDCSVQQNNLVCNQEESLYGGVNQILIIARDEKRISIYEDVIEVEDGRESEVEPTPNDTINNSLILDDITDFISRNSLVFTFLLLCLGALIILIPWILYSFWVRSDTDKLKDKDTKFDEDYVRYDNDYKLPDATGNYDNSISTKPSGDNEQFNSYSNESDVKNKDVKKSDRNQVDNKLQSDIDYIDKNLNKNLPNESPVSGRLENTKLPDAYNQDHIPEWLRSDNASDPIGASGTKYSSADPIEGDQPYGTKDYDDS